MDPIIETAIIFVVSLFISAIVIFIVAKIFGEKEGFGGQTELESASEPHMLGHGTLRSQHVFHFVGHSARIARRDFQYVYMSFYAVIFL